MKIEHWKGWTVATKFLGFVGVLAFVGMASGLMAQVTRNSGGGFLQLTGGTVTGPILFAAGTAGAPSVAWSADADGTGTGLFRPSANSVGVAVNGIERGRFDSTSTLFTTTLQTVNSLGWSTTLTGSADVAVGRGGTTGAMRIFSGTVPTCTSNCGTSPSIAGNNSNMTVTLGTSLPVATTFTVTFNGTWTNAPNCVGGRGTTGITPTVAGIVTTTTTAVVNLGANSVDSETYKIICFGP